MLIVSSAYGAPAATTAGASPGAQWRAAVQSAAGREVLPMLGQQDIPDTLPLPNGNTVVAGTVSAAGKRGPANRTLAIAELLANGRLDRRFGDGGVELTPIRLLPWQILALPEGKLLILGPNRYPGSEEPRITRFPDWELLRLLPNGTPDPGFGHGGLLDVSGVPVATEGGDHEVVPELAPGGDVVLPSIIGPPFSPSTVSGLVRLNPDGSRDTSFGSDGVLTLAGGLGAFSVRPDGSMVLQTGQRSGSQLLRLTAGGSPDRSFNGGVPIQLPFYGVESMLVESDGAIELYGYPMPSSLVDNKIWRYTAAGTLDTSWGSAGATDLGPSPGYISQLLATGGGGTLLVTLGVHAGGPLVPVAQGMPAAERPTRARILRLTAAGQIDPTLGGPKGLTVTLPFGGGSYAPGAIANLRENSFMPSGVIQRADGTLLFGGMVEASEAVPTEGGPEPLAWVNGFALAALDHSYRLDTAFTGATRARVSVRVASTRLSKKRVAVALGSSGAAIAVVTVTAADQTIARGTVPLFSIERPINRRTARIPLTSVGRRLLRRINSWVRVRVTAKVTAADLAANHPTARSSATLRG
ncbi:MAG: hypothetical protein ACLQMH_14395 [Solirubrobacteraceae bacterium]